MTTAAPGPADVPAAPTAGDGVTPEPAAPPPRWSRGWWGSVVPTPTARLAAAVGVAAVVVGMAPVAWPLLVVLAAAVVADTGRLPPPWRLRVARAVPAVVPLGQRAELSWHLAHDVGRPVAVRLADELPPSLRAGQRRIAVDVAPAAVTTVTTTIVPSRRGRMRPSHVTVRVVGPWGLVSRQHTRSLPGSIDVHPTFRSRTQAELRITRGRILDVGLRSARALGRGTDFEALRDYTPDDEFRRIDWAATARRGRPIVRTYRAERNQTVVLLLDTGRLMAGLVGGVPRLDHAMDAAMALTTVATRLGDRAGLVAFSAEVRATVPPRAGRDQPSRVTRAMFDLEPDLTESAYDEVFGRTVALHRRRSLLVLLTELATEALPETLVPALPLLLRRHLVVVASVRDPEVEQWRSAIPADAGAAYRAAGAVTVRRARDRAADLLRRTGATVVDAEPQELAGRLADAYLDVKSTGRL